MTPEEATAMPSAARVTVASYLGTAVLHIQGELDATTARTVCGGLTDAAGEATVLLDLTGVGVIDSVGLGALLSAIRGIHAQGGRVAAVGGPAATTALRAAGIDRLVFLADTPLAGLGWLHHPG
ncbi:MAG TPA: STAS domain-containing protein [Acidimicrobiales bacterium]|nr:STAS domain-containing protein [Acidimicrobiales bacterium]